MGDKRSGSIDEEESLPSDLSDDEWVEIVKFQKEQYEEERRRDQQRFLAKKQQLREVLDR